MSSTRRTGVSIPAARQHEQRQHEQRQHERQQAGRLYGRESSEVAGPLREPAPVVEYQEVLTRHRDAVRQVGLL